VPTTASHASDVVTGCLWKRLRYHGRRSPARRSELCSGVVAILVARQLASVRRRRSGFEKAITYDRDDFDTGV